MNITAQVIEYETGMMNEVDVVNFFAHLIRTKLAWQLQGHYGRTASSFIQDGLIDEFGNLTPKTIDILNAY
jgi:hypothetical protein